MTNDKCGQRTKVKSQMSYTKCRMSKMSISNCQSVKIFQKVKNVKKNPKYLLCHKIQKSEKYQMSSDKFQISNFR